ncbi:protein of unknown function [Candidatus Methylomirabilis oxygeniifera]|uniref:Uncharacterized protein n=1 Tax=Methylomirabilis oxygeniifera TaxID=671143 RepID=D5MG84_METO1|nr:protein of unknown function [Candidatus Methylomirabilis oxyfera]
MATQIEEDAGLLLGALAEEPRDSYVSGGHLQQKTGLDPGRINDAIAILVDSGLAEWLQVMGTAPFDFGKAAITPRGRYEYQRAIEEKKIAAERQPPGGMPRTTIAAVAGAIRPPVPVGFHRMGLPTRTGRSLPIARQNKSSFGLSWATSSSRNTTTQPGSNRTSRPRLKMPSPNTTNARSILACHWSSSLLRLAMGSISSMRSPVTS